MSLASRLQPHFIVRSIIFVQREVISSIVIIMLKQNVKIKEWYTWETRKIYVILIFFSRKKLKILINCVTSEWLFYVLSRDPLAWKNNVLFPLNLQNLHLSQWLLQRLLIEKPTRFFFPSPENEMNISTYNAQE